PCTIGELLEQRLERKNRRHQHHVEEKDSHGRRVVHAEKLETGTIKIECHGFRGGAWTALCQHRDRIVETNTINGAQHEDQEQDWLEQWKSQRAQDAPCGCAIQFGSFERFLRQRLKPGQHDQGYEGRPLPDVKNNDRPERDVEIAEPVWLRETESAQNPVHDTELRIVKITPEQTRHGSRCCERQDHDRTDKTLAVSGPMDEEGYRYAQRHLQADRYDCEFQRDPRRCPEGLIGKYRTKIVESDIISQCTA